MFSNTRPKCEQSCGGCLEEQLSSKSCGESYCDAIRTLLLSGGIRLALLLLPLLLLVGAPEPAGPGNVTQPAPPQAKNAPAKPVAVPPPPCLRSADELAWCDLMGVSAWSPMQAYYYHEWTLQVQQAGHEVRVSRRKSRNKLQVYIFQELQQDGSDLGDHTQYSPIYSRSLPGPMKSLCHSLHRISSQGKTVNIRTCHM